MAGVSRFSLPLAFFEKQDGFPLKTAGMTGGGAAGLTGGRLRECLPLTFVIEGREGAAGLTGEGRSGRLSKGGTGVRDVLNEGDS